MGYEEMYRLPMINPPCSMSDLDLPVGSEKGSMYKLPKIQGSLSSDVPENPLQILENRQEIILKQLENLKIRVENLKENSMPNQKKSNGMLDIVLHCSYHTPPTSIPLACRWLQNKGGLKVFTSCHIHSSVRKSIEHLSDFLPPSNCTSRTEASIRITIIWKEDVNRDPEGFVSILPDHKVKGEVNVLRFLNRQYGLLRGSENNDLSTSESKSDEWLDRLHSGAIWGDSRAIGLRISSVGQGHGLTEILKDIEQIVSKQCFLINDKNPGIADLVAYATLYKTVSGRKQYKSVEKYINTCQTYFGSCVTNMQRVIDVI